MNELINLIEDTYYKIKENKDIILVGIGLATVLGLTLGFIMLPFFR